MAVSLDDVQALWVDVLNSSRTTLEPLAQDAAHHWGSAREGFIWLVLAAPDLWMDVAWTAAVCYDRRRTFAYRSFIYCLATCLLFSYAGGATTRLILGEAPPVLGSNTALLASALTWFLMFFTPLRHLYSFLPLRLLFVVGQAICWQRCICFAVELGVSRFPQSFVAPVLLPIFAGSAGGVMMNLEKRFFGEDGGTSTLGVKLSFLTGLIYYSQHPAALSHGLLEPTLSLDDAKVLVAVVLVGWSIVAELWRPINPFGAAEAIFGWVFLDAEQAAVWWPRPASSGKPTDITKQKSAQSSGGKAKSANKDLRLLADIEEDGHHSPATLRNRKKRK